MSKNDFLPLPPPSQLTALQADIDKGLADIAAGRVHDFNMAQIIARGRRLLKKT
jgi:hypothetical protein